MPTRPFPPRSIVIPLMLAFAAATTAYSAEPAHLFGEYVADNSGLQVIDLGDGTYECVVYSGGLPGQAKESEVRNRTKVEAEGVKELIDELGVTPVKRTSPTLGKKPPREAIVLFDGTQESIDSHWEPGAKLSPEGWLIAGATSKRRFQDYHLHAEFKSPLEPLDRGQQRGNSGIYHQGRYETQILDSFGLEGKDNECGGIYTVRAPNVNVCFPPESWQTYDVDFTAARFNEAGEKSADAKLTVRLNGVLVHEAVAVPYATRAAILKEGPEPGPIYLQDHGDAVRFRNIWIVEH